MQTNITEEHGRFVVQVRREFTTMEEAQHFAASVQFGGEKVDRRKLRPRVFDEFCEYLPDSTLTHKRAKCKICFHLYGHIRGISESTFTLEWHLGADHQAEAKDRENNEASRHLKKKVIVDLPGEPGVAKTVAELHAIYKAEPAKYEAPAPPPPHQPMMPNVSDIYDLEEAVEVGDMYAKQVKQLAIATAYVAIAMQEPVSEGKVSLEAHAKAVMKKGGVELQGPEYVGSEYNANLIERFLCGLQRSDVVDAAVKVFQTYWLRGVNKAAKNRDYFAFAKGRFDMSRTLYNEIMEKARVAFAGAEVIGPWIPNRWLQSRGH